MTQSVSGQDNLPQRAQYGYWNMLTTRWADNDCYGHINNAAYYTYIDSVVNNYLIEAGGLNPDQSPEIGLVVQSGCQFKGSFSYPEPIEAGLRVLRLGNSSVEYEVGMFVPGAPVPHVWGGYVHVFVDRQTKTPVAIPETMRSALEALKS